LAAALMTACSSTPSNGTSAAAKTASSDAEKGVICTYEKPTGSFLKEKRCTTAAQRQAERDQQNTLMDVRSGSNSGQ
jgi:hypothetical protein